MHGTLPPHRYYVETFARSAAMREQQSRRLHERQREQQKAEAKAEATDDALLDAAVAVVMAADSDIESLQSDIGIYQTATVEALQANENELIEARRKVQEMLDKAYVHPDGRRVFKTEDGLRVFDEDGNEIRADQISPDEIDDMYTKWEAYQRETENLERVESEREALINYQTKLDEAQERLEKGDLTQAEFDKLQDDLLNEMPETVRARAPGFMQEQEATKQAAKPAGALEISDDMLPSTVSVKSPAPV
jgi:hypothetical protein